MRFCPGLVAFVCGLSIALPAGAAVPVPQAASQEKVSLAISRVATPPRLDDWVAGKRPAGLTSVSGFRQREPGDGDPASRETTVWLGYDSTNLYVVFDCKEDPSAIRARMSKRESIMGDDIVALLVDTFRDQRRAYSFVVNPLGIQMDGISAQGQDDDWSFDTVWHSEGRLTGDGYLALIAVPFRSLRFPDAPSQTWGIALGRIVPQRNETAFWPYITRRISSFGEQLATLTGLEGISPGRNLQFIPYSAFTGSRYLDESVPAFASRKEGRVGLDAKMVVKDALTVDLTVNPDFSQVESDEPQVTINQRFEVFFPERRPFFIENAGLFATPEQLFFSRRVADPEFGARLTGKAGRWAVAGLAMDDRGRGARVAAANPLRDQRAAVGVLRLQREVGASSHVGLFASGLDFGPSRNTVLAADARIQLTKNWNASGQVTGTRTTGLEGLTRSGAGIRAGVAYDSRVFAWDANYTDRSPDFFSEPGFIRRVDMRQADTWSRYRWFPKGRRVLSFGPSGSASLLWNYAGQVQDWSIEPRFAVELPSATEFSARVERAYERYQGLAFDRHRTTISAGSEWLEWLSVEADAAFGTAINYYPAAGARPSLASSRQTSLGLVFRPSSRLRMEETYIYDRLRTREGEFGLAGPPRDIFNLHIVRLKANYQFSREFSLRAIVDYNAVRPDEALVDLASDRRINADVLLTYLINPGTALYVGYTDLYANVELVGGDGGFLRRTLRPTGPAGRQVFLKLSYLFRY